MKNILLLLILFLIPINTFALENGENAPDFELKSFFGDRFSLKDNKDKIIVLEWTNPGCPFVKKHYQNGNMQALQKKYREKGALWLTINSTNIDHQDYLTTELAKKNVAEWKIDSKYMLNDSEGSVGKLYGATSTPHMFIINRGKLVYQGAIDNNPDIYENEEVKINYVTNALELILANKPILEAKTNQYGCGVKYKD